MQIQGDYNSYSSSGYGHKHTHHITKCLHEEKKEQQNGGEAGIKADSFAADSSGKAVKQEMVYALGEEQKRTTLKKRGMGFVKNLWDAMGDEGTDEQQREFLSNGHAGMKGIDAVTSAIRQIFTYRIINKWEGVREKFKVSLSTALKHFGKGGTAFSALTDPKGHFTGKRETGRGLEENKEKGTRRNEDPVAAVPLSDSHLMDSYSKTGAYCRLNENLTYQKKSTAVKPVNQPVKGE